MSRFFISGLLNIETTVAIPGFPLDYAPVHYPFFGINSTLSGVGYNIAKALALLGNRIDLHSLVGPDWTLPHLRQELASLGIDSGGLEEALSATAQSVILYEPSGRRQIHVDLKECQERPLSKVEDSQLAACDMALLCNINFSRPLLARAKALGRPIACDVHVLHDIHDDYNRDFLPPADILSLSDEGLGGRLATDYLRELQEHYGIPIVVMGCGAAGAYLSVRRDHRFFHAPASAPRGVKNSVGAGDALFSAFVHDYCQNQDPYLALQRATRYAGWKVGATGAAEGLLDQAGWLQHVAR